MATDDVRCSNCQSTDYNPTPRSFDMDLPAVVLCKFCTVALSAGNMEMFQSMTRQGTGEKS